MRLLHQLTTQCDVPTRGFYRCQHPLILRQVAGERTPQGVVGYLRGLKSVIYPSAQYSENCRKTQAQNLIYCLLGSVMPSACNTLIKSNASELSGKFVFVSDSFRSRSRAQICLLERVDSQSAKRGGFQAGRAKLNSDAITQDCASSSALSVY